MLGGGLATWARGGPPTDHDVDFYLREDDAPARARRARGDRHERPRRRPRAGCSRRTTSRTTIVLVDLIFRPAGGPIGDEHFERATPMELMAQPVLVASIDDVLSTKLMALTEQEPDFRAVLEIARSLREQIDWAFVRAPHRDVAVRGRLLHARRVARDRSSASVEPAVAVVRRSVAERLSHPRREGSSHDNTVTSRRRRRRDHRATRPDDRRSPARRHDERPRAAARRGHPAAPRSARRRAGRPARRDRGRARARRGRRRGQPAAPSASSTSPATAGAAGSSRRC